MSGASGWQAQLTCITQTLARANGAVPGSIPGKSGFKAYRLYPAGVGLTPKRFKQTFPTTVGGLEGLNRPAVNALSKLR